MSLGMKLAMFILPLCMLIWCAASADTGKEAIKAQAAPHDKQPYRYQYHADEKDHHEQPYYADERQYYGHGPDKPSYDSYRHTRGPRGPRGPEGQRGPAGFNGTDGAEGPRGPVGFLQNGLFDCNALVTTPVRASLGLNPVDNRGAWQALQATGFPYNAGVYYTFIPDVTGVYNVNTCGQLQGGDRDSVIAVYAVPTTVVNSVHSPYNTQIPSACSSSPISRADDACGLETSLNFDAVSGQSYIIAIGEWNFAANFWGTFTVSFVSASKVARDLQPQELPKVPAKDDRATQG